VGLAEIRAVVFFDEDGGCLQLVLVPSTSYGFAGLGDQCPDGAVGSNARAAGCLERRERISPLDQDVLGAS
jgi:hypothetical protein